MSDDLSKRRLGRGLAALIGEMDQPVPVGEPQRAVNADGEQQQVTKAPLPPQ